MVIGPLDVSNPSATARESRRKSGILPTKVTESRPQPAKPRERGRLSAFRRSRGAPSEVRYADERMRTIARTLATDLAILGVTASVRSG